MNAPLPPTQPAPPASPGAVDSLVWGIVGVTVLPLIGSIVALAMGRKARDLAAADGLPDPPLARAGRILGWVGLAVVAIPLGALLASGMFAWLLSAIFG